MRKLFLIFILIITCVGCGKKNEVKTEEVTINSNSEEFVDKAETETSSSVEEVLDTDETETSSSAEEVLDTDKQHADNSTDDSQQEVSANSFEYSYGVFLGLGPESMDKFKDYEIVVIDAQYFTKEQIDQLHTGGHKVYSYINVGSVEDFRSYYDKYEPYTLGDYENWDEERWVDVSNKEWKNFVLNDLAPSILDKGVDGLFVDNIDVYYFYQRDDIYNGLTEILKGFKSLNTYVCINGGDTYIMEYIARGGSFHDVADAVNQETVFSKILWDGDNFSRSSAEDREYFKQYLESVASNGGDVFLLEYSKDQELIEEIKTYCNKNNFRYYISSTLELL